MFSQIFDFAARRSVLNAIGWYVVFAIIGLAFAIAVAGLVSAVMVARGADASSLFAPTLNGGFKSGMNFGEYLNITYVSVVTLALALKKQRSAVNIGLYALAIVLSLVTGTIPALVPLAFVTTRV